MLKVKIKAGKISNLTDARYFSAWGVGWLGFQIGPPQSGRLSPNEFLVMKEWLEGPSLIGEFEELTADEIKLIASQTGLLGVELGEHFPIEEAKLLSEMARWIHVSSSTFHQTEVDEILKKWDFAEYLVLDGSELEVKNKKTMAKLKSLAQGFNLFLECRSVEDAIVMLEHTGASGLSVSGGPEEKIGLKSYEGMDKLFEHFSTE